MLRKPVQLVFAGSVSGDPVFYKCSPCDQLFMLPEDGSPKEALSELYAAFKGHVRQEHPAHKLML